MTTPTVNHEERANKIRLEAQNPKQRDLIRALKTETQIVTVGPAGTGKTYVPTVWACQQFLRGKIKKILLTRPIVPTAGENLGFLPGTLEKKMAPWARPVVDIIREQVGAKTLEDMMKNGSLEVMPLAFMRGHTHKEAFVILDEAQNTTVGQMKMLVTRTGEDTQLVVDGDIGQSDLIGNESGLEWLIKMITMYDIPAQIIQFSREDVVRSGIVQRWVEAIEDYAEVNRV